MRIALVERRRSYTHNSLVTTLAGAAKEEAFDVATTVKIEHELHDFLACERAHRTPLDARLMQ